MILNYEKKQVILKDGFRKSDFIVLDVRDFTLDVGKIKLEWCIEILNLIRRTNQANDIYKMYGSQEMIGAEILHKAIDAVMLEKPLSEENIKAYFDTRIKLTRFFERYIDIVRPSGLSITPEIDYLLLGKGFNIENEDIPDGLFLDYGAMLYDLECENISLEDFISKSRALIEESKLIAEG